LAKETAPLTSLTFQVLLALADEDRHGYGIIKEIEARSGPGSAPSTGALYLALQRMGGDGLIEGAPEPPAGDHDARRKYYRLTTKGKRATEEEAARLARLVEAARQKKVLAGET
jgi:DNA-binding PadR family transcriptional regulator